MDLGRVGIWCGQFRSQDTGEAREAARELESLGFGALWIPGGAGGDIFGDVSRVLGATTALPVVTGILNIWMHDAAEVASEHARLGAAYPERFLLGLGVSHAPLVEARGDRRYERPRTPPRLPCVPRTGSWLPWAPRCWSWPGIGQLAPTPT